jgi:hypothetical protein
MMDRMDPDRHSFSFTERQRHFRNFIKYWSECIEQFKPDLVISATVPHRVYDYVLYLLCKHKNIEFISFSRVISLKHILPIVDINTIGNLFDKEYNDNFDVKISISDLKRQNRN